MKFLCAGGLDRVLVVFIRKVSTSISKNKFKSSFMLLWRRNHQRNNLVLPLKESRQVLEAFILQKWG